MNNQAPTFAQFQTYQPGRTDIDAEEFAALLPDCEAWIDAYIFPNSVDSSSDSDVIEAYQKAICACVVSYNDNPDGALKAYTSGKVREEFDASTVHTFVNVAWPYLAGSGLLCRWL